MMSLLLRARASVKARIGAFRRKRTERVPGLVGRPEAFALKREFQYSYLLGHGLQPRHTLLDFGCGVLRGGIPLIEYLDSGNYCGLDVRQEVLRGAGREVRRNGLRSKKPLLVHGADIAHLSLGRRFDFAWAFSVLFHLSNEKLDECLNFVARHLAADSVFHANVLLGTLDPGTWLQFPVVWRTLEEYAERARAAGLYVTALGTLSEFGHHSPTDPEEDAQTMLCFTPIR
jgi:hypothetical protein